MISDLVAETIGWPTGNTFQLQVGDANLAVDILGLATASRFASRGGMATAGLTLGAIPLELWGALLAGGAVAVIGTSGGTEEQDPVDPAGEPPH